MSLHLCIVSLSATVILPLSCPLFKQCLWMGLRVWSGRTTSFKIRLIINWCSFRQGWYLRCIHRCINRWSLIICGRFRWWGCIRAESDHRNMKLSLFLNVACSFFSFAATRGERLVDMRYWRGMVWSITSESVVWCDMFSNSRWRAKSFTCIAR